MPGWAWVLIIVAVVALIAAAGWMVYRQRRTEGLRQRFGPEYDRAVSATDRREAEAELDDRRERREQLDIRTLPPEARERYLVAWRETQARFVDSPSEAIREADDLVTRVMVERGYPMEDFEQRSADVSVDHPHVVDNYRAAHAASLANDHGKATTEDLREAMVHYRSLFEELVGDGNRDRPRAEGEPRADGDDERAAHDRGGP
jgi:ABC-type nickel/cobalt efflux system permease component RcnA